ncbi:MAG: DNA replication/repair protein RecF [Ahrensia sp.]|nr:DNA replication/repair protein RecF [Ahrensia sp.]
MSASTSVWIERLKLDRFRNYEKLDLPLEQHHVVLTGENGSGKTNLLEAVSFLSPGRGLRRAAYDKVALAGGDGSWAMHATLQGAVGEAQIGTGLRTTTAGVETQRRVRINGAPAKASDDLLDHGRVLWLTPAMDGLFTGSPGDRRRFLDRLVLAIDPLHARRVTAFEKAMRGRNKLLEDRGADPAWLSGIEEEMVQSAVAVATARSELVSLLRGMIETAPHGTFPQAEIALEGVIEPMIGRGASADIEDEYRALLQRNRSADAAAGRTLHGPHRSDLAVRHAEKDMEAALCSTGEQKALLLGLILAHARLTASVSKMVPILLLDEVAAHLDSARRASLFDLIDNLGCQAWMTGTDQHLFESLGGRAQYLTVSAGTVAKAG